MTLTRSALACVAVTFCLIASSSIGLASAGLQDHGISQPRVLSSRVHYASVPVRVCPSSYASSGVRGHTKIPRWKVIAIPGDLTDQIAVYTDTRQFMEVLGPNGWKCVASFGNGPVGFTIFAPGEVSPGFDRTGGRPQKKSGRRGINIIGYGASLDIDQLVCPYFRAARVDLYKSIPTIPSSLCRIPHGERVATINRELKRVDDPPEVAGDNYPSGSVNWALGNAFLATYPGGGSYLMTCTLPSSDHALCYAAMAWFGTRWIRSSQP